jgi:RNA polymerase sigma-70 factor (ECF subfamily)
VSGARVILFGGELGDEPGDAALVEALRRRDARAELIAWRRFAPSVSRTVRRLAGPRCDEEDLSQEVFLHFFRSIGALREPSAVRSFLTGICIRVVRREVRGRWLRRWLLLTEHGALPEVAAPVADPGVREAVARYYAILDRLGSEARSLFVARHLEGLGLVEVAALHGLSVSTTQRRLVRAQARVAVLTGDDPAIAAYLQRDPERGPG